MTLPTARPALVTPTGVVAAPPGLNREQWLAARRKGVSPDTAGILGMSRYTSPLVLYLNVR